MQATIWFASMASLTGVLSDKNRGLFKLIDQTKPQSLTDLAELTGHKVPNLSRTLRAMARYGIVELQHGPHGVISGYTRHPNHTGVGLIPAAHLL